MDRDKAEALIRKNGTVAGSFVLRPSSSHHGSFALTVAAPNGDIKHYPIELLVDAPYTGEFLLMCPGERRRFVTLPEVGTTRICISNKHMASYILGIITFRKFYKLAFI